MLVKELYSDDYLSDGTRVELARRDCILTGQEYLQLRVEVGTFPAEGI